MTDITLPEPAMWYARGNVFSLKAIMQQGWHLEATGLFDANKMRAYAAAAVAAERARWESAIGAEMPVGFKDWHQNSSAERPAIAAWVIRNLRTDRDSWADQASARTQDALDLVAAERERILRDVAGLHMAQSVNNQNYPSAWHDGVDAALDAIRRGA